MRVIAILFPAIYDPFGLTTKVLSYYLAKESVDTFTVRYLGSNYDDIAQQILDLTIKYDAAILVSYRDGLQLAKQFSYFTDGIVAINPKVNTSKWVFGGKIRPGTELSMAADAYMDKAGVTVSKLPGQFILSKRCALETWAEITYNLMNMTGEEFRAEGFES